MTRYQLILRIILAFLLLVSTACIYIPQIIYFSNQAEFAVAFLSLIYLPTVLALVFMAIVTALLTTLPLKILKFVSAYLLLIALLAWIKGDLIGMDIGLIDGSLLHIKPNIGIRSVLLFLIVIMTGIFHQAINKHAPTVVFLIIIGQLLITGYQIIVHPKPVLHTQVSDDEFENYSSQKNVILIILDTFGSQIFQQIKAQNPAITQNLEGFVVYPDTISNYPATIGSIPSILSGSMLPVDMPYQQFLQQEVAQNGLPKQMEKLGYLSSFTSILPVFADIYPTRYRFEPPIDQNNLRLANSAQLIDYALIRMLPDFLKYSYYNKGRWFFSQKLSSKLKLPTTLTEQALMSVDFHINNLSIEGDQPRFKILHYGLPHPEYVYDSECRQLMTTGKKSDLELMFQQSTCALKKLNQLMVQYKELGIYNNSMIVVTSDHGARLLKNMGFTGFPSFFELNTSGVFFMIKGINQHQPFKTIENPLSLLKLFELIIDERNHLSSFDTLESSKRPFYSYRNPHKGADGFLPDAPLYEVKGDYSRADSWHLQKFININCAPETIPFTMKFRTNHRASYCSKHGFARPDRKNNGTWSRSVDARILFNLSGKTIRPTKNYLMRLVFLPKLNEKQTQVSMKLVLNGQDLEQQTFSDKKQQTWEVMFKGSKLQADAVNELKLLLPDVQSERELGISDNTRKLGVFLKSIEIINTQ